MNSFLDKIKLKDGIKNIFSLRFFGILILSQFISLLLTGTGVCQNFFKLLKH